MKKNTFNLKAFAKVLVALMVILSSSISFGQGSIFSNTITGTTPVPSADNPYTTGQVVNANITVTGIGRGSGISANTGADRYNAKGFGSSSFESSDYFTFTITPKTGYKINFTSFVYNAQRSGTGPKEFALRSGDFSSNIDTKSVDAAVTTMSQTISLSATTFQNVTGAIEFRFYGWSGTETGTFSINDFIFNGTVTTAGPTAPADPVATPATNVTSTSFTANWNAVTGATSYSLDVATDSNFNNILPAYTALSVTGTSQNVTGLTANTNYYYRVVARNSTTNLASDYSNVITVCGTPVPVADATQTFCGAIKVSDLKATATSTATLNWYTVATGGTALATTATVAAGTRTYYVSQNLNGCEGARIPVAVTVNITAVPTAVAQTFCGATKVSDIKVTGTDVKWYATATGGTALAGTDNVFIGTYYATQTLNACESARTPVDITVNNTDAPLVDAQTFCNTTPKISDVIVTGATAVKWYAAVTGGDALATTTALVTGTTYYVSQTLNNCESARTAVPVTINTTAAPVADAQTFCNTDKVATVADLKVNTPLSRNIEVSVTWYAAQTGGDALVSTTILVSGTTYYVSQTINGCESARTPVLVTVNTTAAPVADAQTFCNTDKIATVADLKVNTPVAKGIDVVVTWYDAQTGGDALAATDVLTTDTTYYVSQTINGCESLRTAVPVTVNTTTAPLADAEQIFCNAATVANLTVNRPPARKDADAEVRWYATATGGDALATTEVLTTGTTYYVSQTINGCESLRTAVLATINKTAAPVVTAITFCDAATVANLKATGTAVKWYAAETGGVALDATTVLITGTTYYASQTLNNCESLRTAVVATISTAVKPEGEATQEFTEGKTLADLTVTGDDIVWYSDEALTKVLPDTTVLTDATTYYAVSTVGTCSSDALAVTVKKVLSTAGFDKANFTYYPNPVNDLLTLSYNATISSVEVYNMLGQVVITAKFNANQAQVNTANLAAGTYIVRATANNKTQTFKVVKQ